jgi:hypothetical protein
MEEHKEPGEEQKAPAGEAPLANWPHSSSSFSSFCSGPVLQHAEQQLAKTAGHRPADKTPWLPKHRWGVLGLLVGGDLLERRRRHLKLLRVSGDVSQRPWLPRRSLKRLKNSRGSRRKGLREGRRSRPLLRTASPLLSGGTGGRRPSLTTLPADGRRPNRRPR